MMERRRFFIKFLLGFGIFAGFPTSTQAVTSKIRHVIVIMQENRSFDSYFGTFPGADGIPNGTCVPLDPAHPQNGCVKPFHDEVDANSGGPHGFADALADLNDGITSAKQDGYVLRQTNAALGGRCVTQPNNPLCSGSSAGTARHDVMGYHTAAEIPNYWAYAKSFVLQDAMFEGVRSWSLPAHLDLTSEWVADCSNDNDAMSCISSLSPKVPKATVKYPWVNLFSR